VNVLWLRGFEPNKLDFVVLDAHCRTFIVDGDESLFCGATEHRYRPRRGWANGDDETVARIPISPPTVPNVLVKGVIGQFEGAARQHSGESKYQSFDSLNCRNVLHCDALNVRIDHGEQCFCRVVSGRHFYFGAAGAYAVVVITNIHHGNVVGDRGRGVFRSTLTCNARIPASAKYGGV
jgi:hypothetical protein